MFEIDKKKFGAFVSELRKEKGYTQKELAEKLFVSDKAVSKWETGASIPDTTLLLPLAELLGVSATELLVGERVREDASMNTEQVEDVVKTALAYSEKEVTRAYQTKNKWPVIYACAAIIGIFSTLLSYQLQLRCDSLITVVILSMIFGAYFCLFVKTRLSTYYDENRCGLYYDGIFRMNVPGVAFNNTNWPHVVRVIRIWSCLVLALYPVINIVMNLASAQLWSRIELYVLLLLVLGGLSVPVYIVGKKYE